MKIRLLATVILVTLALLNIFHIISSDAFGIFIAIAVIAFWIIDGIFDKRDKDNKKQ